MRGSSGEVGAGSKSGGHAGSRFFPPTVPRLLLVACTHADMYASFRPLTNQWAWGLTTFMVDPDRDHGFIRSLPYTANRPVRHAACMGINGMHAMACRM